MDEIPDHLRPGLDIAFVGFNPSLRSGESGHHYANPHNRFWRILHRSGLTPRLYRPEEDGDLPAIGLGLTNIVARPTRNAAELTAQDYAEGGRELRGKIERFRPRVVCYVGKGVYEAYTGLRGVAWGRQPIPVVERTVDYVAPSSSGLVRMPLDEVIGHYGGLRQLRDDRWGAGPETFYGRSRK